jgi:hypothetical protein
MSAASGCVRVSCCGGGREGWAAGSWRAHRTATWGSRPIMPRGRNPVGVGEEELESSRRCVKAGDGRLTRMPWTRQLGVVSAAALGL